MTATPTHQNLGKQLAGALLWGGFVALAPFEILVFGAVVWIPCLIWRERRRTARYGFLPGGLARLGLVVAVVWLAAVAPLKSEDARVGPLPRTKMTLEELATARVISLREERFNAAPPPVAITLPSLTPSRREVLNAINQQTSFEASIFKCGNGATILFGSGVGPIRVSERKASEAAGPVTNAAN